MRKKITVIEIAGRRWFRRSAGNTYSSVAVTVHYKDGTAESFTVPRTSGYGDYFAQMAGDALERRGFMPGREKYPNGGSESLSYYCRRKGIVFVSHVSDVTRERDLHTSDEG